ncbi:hypothetical protein BJX70DRAFT_376182 [Aspergillus crustosus]
MALGGSRPANRLDGFSRYIAVEPWARLSSFHRCVPDRKLHLDCFQSATTLLLACLLACLLASLSGNSMIHNDFFKSLSVTVNRLSNVVSLSQRSAVWLQCCPVVRLVSWSVRLKISVLRLPASDQVAIPVLLRSEHE